MVAAILKLPQADRQKKEITSWDQVRWKNRKGLGVLYIRKHRTGELWLCTSIGNDRRGTGLRWPNEGNPAFHTPKDLSRDQRAVYTQGMEKLQQRALRYMNGQPIEEDRTGSREGQPPTREPMTLYKAITDFKEKKLPTFSPDIQSRYRSAMGHFLVGEGYDDMLLDYQALRERICERKSKCELDLSTMQKVLYKLDALLEYFVQSGWLDRNPMRTIGNVEVETEPKTVDDLFLPEQWAEIRSDAYKLGEQPGLWCDTMYAMGLRMRESINLSIDDYRSDEHGTYLIIRGKKVKNNPSGERAFPLTDTEGVETIPGILVLVERLRALAESRGTSKIFEYDSDYSVNHWFLPILVKRGYRPEKGGGLSVKSIRASAIYNWRYVLKYPISLRALLAGHSEEVQKRWYLTESPLGLQAGEIAEVLTDFRSEVASKQKKRKKK